MADLYVPKVAIKALLDTLVSGFDGLKVYQARPEVIATFPCLTFSLSGNSVTLELDGEIGVQDIEVTIDIWTDTSTESTSLLGAVEEVMRGASYRLAFSQDVPDPDLKSHIVTRFNLIY